MGLKYKEIKEILTEKKYCEGDEVALIQTQNMAAMQYWGGLLGALMASSNNERFAVTKVGEQLAFVPLDNKSLNFEKAFAYSKDKIQKTKVGGLGACSSFKFWTVDGNKHKYNIYKGKKDLVSILESLGFNTKGK